MPHPCKDCHPKFTGGRGFCPILKRELAIEGCNRQRNRSAKRAWDYKESTKKWEVNNGTSNPEPGSCEGRT